MSKHLSSTPIPLEVISVEVIGSDGAKHCATIWPALLSASDVIGTIEWDCNPPQFSLVKARGKRLTPCGQRLLLIYAAVDECSMPAAEFICAGKWTTVKLLLPNLVAAPNDLIRVSLSRQDNLATLEVDSEPSLNAIQHIPPCLQEAAVGLAMVEMTSRILLGHTWQTQELLVSSGYPK